MTRERQPKLASQEPTDLDLVAIYFTEINQTPLLTVEEERELTQRVASGDPEAKEQLIEANQTESVALKKLRGFLQPPLKKVVGFINR